ncbi:NUDIX hydrolase [Streptomyces alboflavus]|uniref:NUDIX hydrolase n=1 Tax=Streptomyces alboflavus TaxID=67267 RepID=UPI000F656F1F|nr:NUDIX domain-containing protein [Streptomyces alboflavus]
MSGNRHKTCTDLHLLLRDDGQLWLGERKNTGYMDGHYHLPSGHLDEGESATAGLIREAAEELGITLRPEDLALVHVMHHHTNEGRTALFFEASRWQGTVENREPDKCAGWQKFAPDALPEKMIPYAAEALAHIAKGVFYAERGWAQAQ